MLPSAQTLLVVAIAVSVAVCAAATPAYDEHLAKLMVLYDKVAQCNATAVRNWSCEPCTQHFRGAGPVFVLHNATTHTQGYVVYNRTTNVIATAFRGTIDLTNWLEDFDFTFVDYPPCGNYTANDVVSRAGLKRQRRVFAAKSVTTTTSSVASDLWIKHGRRTIGDNLVPKCQVANGDHVAYQGIRPQLLSAVGHILELHPTADIRVAGWSLGGSLAVHAALDLVTTLPKRVAHDGRTISPVRSLHTMGCPRQGNPVFASWAHTTFASLNVTVVRLVHQNDLVPKLPPLEAGFEHVPHEIWYPYAHANLSSPAAKKFVVCNDSAAQLEDRYCSDQVILQHVDTKDHLEVMGIALGCGNTPS